MNPEDNEPYTCKVCFLEFEKEDVSKMVFGKCCLNSYFHRECAARMSMNQGIHQTRCPACRDKEVYIKSIVAQGLSPKYQFLILNKLWRRPLPKSRQLGWANWLFRRSTCRPSHQSVQQFKRQGQPSRQLQISGERQRKWDQIRGYAVWWVWREWIACGVWRRIDGDVGGGAVYRGQTSGRGLAL